MKKLLLILISTFTLTSISFAQENLPLSKTVDTETAYDYELYGKKKVVYLDTETKQYYLDKRAFISKYGRDEFKYVANLVKQANNLPLTKSVSTATSDREIYAPKEIFYLDFEINEYISKKEFIDKYGKEEFNSMESRSKQADALQKSSQRETKSQYKNDRWMFDDRSFICRIRPVKLYD